MKTKNITLTAIGIALYVCLSMVMKIPVISHISLDLGYIVLPAGLPLDGLWAISSLALSVVWFTAERKITNGLRSSALPRL